MERRPRQIITDENVATSSTSPHATPRPGRCSLSRTGTAGESGRAEPVPAAGTISDSIASPHGRAPESPSLAAYPVDSSAPCASAYPNSDGQFAGVGCLVSPEIGPACRQCLLSRDFGGRCAGAVEPCGQHRRAVDRLTAVEAGPEVEPPEDCGPDAGDGNRRAAALAMDACRRIGQLALRRRTGARP